MEFIILLLVLILTLIANRKRRFGYDRQVYLMTSTERRFYLFLCDYLKHTDYKVYSKVRLLDLVKPADETDKAAFLKVSNKHIDFVVCSLDTGIQCAIELNDMSHKQADRISRDKFVLGVLEDVGLHFVAYNVGRRYDFSVLDFLLQENIA